VIERFTRRAPQEFSANKHAKTFARVDCCVGPSENPHAVSLRTGRYVDRGGGGQRLAFLRGAGDDRLRIIMTRQLRSLAAAGRCLVIFFGGTAAR
jgi:hypothetical protein